MKKDFYTFPAILSFDEDGISVEFPDLPGCLTCGDNTEEAINRAKEALGLHLYGVHFLKLLTTISDINARKK